ncbi:MAG TPA: filamentous hemagglutinin N-terminal domain-containing protein [Stellaceae bacterium]|nr:filamentous hemagglutinin N-terminal domain-containing protein [Stellaceae bacterium]
MATGCAAVAVLACPAAEAQLKGLSVAAGQAALSTPSATSTIIQQTTEKAILNWQNFSIASGASVTFQQPDSSAIALNRVLGQSGSFINGNLAANGQVWLINPNGILFGHGSTINVGGLIATTSDIRDQDFLAGHYSFGIASSDATAAVVNFGTITAASGGSVVLAGPRIDNQGLIEANLGSVVLGGASGFTVDFSGDKLLSFEITGPVLQQPLLRDGQPAAALVANSGAIDAAGGKVLLTARAARSVLDNVINTTGIVEATGAAVVNGEIVLDAGPAGAAKVSGTLDASGTSAGETGGSITITGNQIDLQSGAKLDASGAAGGGTILVGGNFHGAGPLPNATTTTIEQGATLVADAIGSGDGGNVAVWASGTTSFAGAISARGGTAGGNGGFVETSGANLQVGPKATVDTTAPHGSAGTWLLDPDVIVIALGGAALAPGGVLGLSQDPGATDTIDPNSIAAALGTTNVLLEAHVDIAVLNSFPFVSSPYSLSLLSQGSIEFFGSVQNFGTGAINIIAGWDGTTPLATVLASSLTSGTFGHAGGDVTIGGVLALNDTPHGNVAVGSLYGPTNLMAANLLINGATGIAELGNGVSGPINVALTGNLTLLAGPTVPSDELPSIGCNNCDTYAVIGGGVSGPITVNVAGNINLIGGSGLAGFAQIGNGGADAGACTAGCSAAALVDTGAITVTAASISMQGGSGNGDYAQIGNGGLFAGAATATSVSGGSTDPTNALGLSGQGPAITSGSVSYGGNITVTATGATGLSVRGGSGPDSYAQIGNGGDQSNIGLNVTNGSIGESGDIAVTVGTTNHLATLALTAGTGNDSYAQIGNGGYGANYGASASGGITISGKTNVVVDGTLSTALAGGNQQPNSYAQIGQGDASGTGSGTASGATSVVVYDPPSLTPGTAPNSPACIGDAANCSVPGTITVLNQGSPLQGFNSIIVSLLAIVPPQNGLNQPPAGSPGSGNQGGGTQGQGGTPGQNTGSTPGTLESLSQQAPGGGNAPVVDPPQVTDSVAMALDKFRNLPASARTIISGILTENLQTADNGPHGVPPADQDFSSWGHEAAWQWQ